MLIYKYVYHNKGEKNEDVILRTWLLHGFGNLIVCGKVSTVKAEYPPNHNRLTALLPVEKTP